MEIFGNRDGYLLLLHECIEIVFVLFVPAAQCTSVLNDIVHIPLHSLFILPAFYFIVLAKDVEIA